VKLIVGLGNPGKKYERTRHNIGFLVVDRLAERAAIDVDRKKDQALTGEWARDGEKVLLVKPETFMNKSGDALAALFNYHPVAHQDVVVIHDDLDLPFGRIRIRERGRAAGHRGMISVLGALGDGAFCRLRIGIGRPPPGVEPVDYVLQKFTPEETAALGAIVGRAADAVEAILDRGVRAAMETFNRAE
jgi:peptidyl-tRNA hydrolase, PTH1 family